MDLVVTRWAGPWVVGTSKAQPLCGPSSGLAISRHRCHLPGKLLLGAEDIQEHHPFFLPGTGQGLGTRMPEAAGSDARWDGAAVTNPWS